MSNLVGGEFHWVVWDVKDMVAIVLEVRIVENLLIRV